MLERKTANACDSLIWRRQICRFPTSEHAIRVLETRFAERPGAFPNSWWGPDLLSHEESLFRHSRAATSPMHRKSTYECCRLRRNTWERCFCAIVAGVLTLPESLSGSGVHRCPDKQSAIHDHNFTVDAISQCRLGRCQTRWNGARRASGGQGSAEPEGFLNDPRTVPEPETAMLCGAALLTLGLSGSPLPA